MSRSRINHLDSGNWTNLVGKGDVTSQSQPLAGFRFQLAACVKRRYCPGSCSSVHSNIKYKCSMESFACLSLLALVDKVGKHPRLSKEPAASHSSGNSFSYRRWFRVCCYPGSRCRTLNVRSSSARSVKSVANLLCLAFVPHCRCAWLADFPIVRFRHAALGTWQKLISLAY